VPRSRSNDIAAAHLFGHGRDLSASIDNGDGATFCSEHPSETGADALGCTADDCAGTS
jgi:hypothetical protein